jgi:hypothetical protein
MAGYYGYLCKDLNRTIPANSYDDCNSFAKRLARKCAHSGAGSEAAQPKAG